MKNSFIVFLGTLVLFILCSPSSGEENAIGSVKTLKGDAFIHRNGKTLKPQIGDALFENDLLKTGSNSSMGVIFKDDTVLSLGPESEIMIDNFVFAPVEGNLGFVLKIMKGIVSYISGKIGKISPQSVQVETPVATIGIRGTHMLIKVVE